MRRGPPGMRPQTEKAGRMSLPAWIIKKVAAATFLKRMHPAARIIYLPVADKFHTCRARCVFSHVHAAAENIFHSFRACGRKTLRGIFDTLKRKRCDAPLPFLSQGERFHLPALF